VTTPPTGPDGPRADEVAPAGHTDPPADGAPPDRDVPAATGGTVPRADDVPQWRRLSNRMLLIHPVQSLLQFLPALLGLLIAGTTSGNGPIYSLLGAAAAIAFGILRWLTTSYRISTEQVQVRRGVLNRRVLSVRRDRIRTVDVSAPALHRVLGLARVTVGTGLSDRTRNDGLRLDALNAATAAELREELLHRAEPGPAGSAATGSGAGAAVAGSVSAGEAAHGTPADGPGSRTGSRAGGFPWTPPAPPTGTELARLSPRWIGYGPFTLSGLVTVGVIGAFLSRLVNEFHLDPTRYGATRELAARVLHTSLPLLVGELVLGLLVLAAIASTCGYVLAFWGFRLTRLPGGTLHVTRGLVTTRAITLEERRLRGVEVSEPLLLRAVGGARCIAIATGLRVGRGAERGGSLLLPSAPRAEARRVAIAVLGRAEPITVALTRHGPAARRRRYTRALVPCALLVLAAVVAHALLPVPDWVPVATLVLLVLAVLVAADRYRGLGHALVDGTLVAGRGSLVRRRSALPTDGIIGWNLRRSYFQRRAGLATLTATTAGGEQAYPVPDLPLADATGLADAALPGLLTPFLVPAGPGSDQGRSAVRPRSDVTDRPAG
jgi:putative membrane protein